MYFEGKKIKFNEDVEFGDIKDRSFQIKQIQNFLQHKLLSR